MARKLLLVLVLLATAAAEECVVDEVGIDGFTGVSTDAQEDCVDIMVFNGLGIEEGICQGHRGFGKVLFVVIKQVELIGQLAVGEAETDGGKGIGDTGIN